MLWVPRERVYNDYQKRILKWSLSEFYITFHSCFGLQEKELQTAYIMSISWASHIKPILCRWDDVYSTQSINRSGYKESAEFNLIFQYYGVWNWDLKNLDQATKGYEWFWDVQISFQSGSLLNEVKGSSINLEQR